MAIVFGGDTGIRPSAFDGFVSKISQEFQRIKTGLVESFTNLTGETLSVPPKPPIERVYVDTGFTSISGTAFVGSQLSNVDDIKTRQIVTQEPQATVYVKKRAFWSLRSENDTRFMDVGEKLLTRATKILFENKCNQIAAYEGVTKASKLISEDAHLDAARLESIADYLSGVEGFFVSELSNQIKEAAFDDKTIRELDYIRSEYIKLTPIVDSIRKIAANQKKLKAATCTNWVIDPDNVADLTGTGRGSGVIELTMISELSTELSLDHDNKGSINLSMEDPYNLCKISNDDVEMALSAAFSEIQTPATIGLGPTSILDAAKEKDEKLKEKRRKRLESGNFLSTSNVADIVFEINGSSLLPNMVVGYITSLTEPFTKDNFRMVFSSLPPEQNLDTTEDRLVAEIFELLNQYVTEVKRLTNENIDNNKDPEVIYARSNLRKFYLGKSIIQPMDGIHVYLRSNTYMGSEMIGPLSAKLNGMSFVSLFRDDQEVSNEFLEEEMRMFDINIPVDLYKTMRTGSFMRNAGTHVFGGLVSTVTESYNAERGYSLSVTGQSTLKWLDLSRVNVRPALDQTQGVLEDPLTPYEITVDPGTGLVVLDPQWTQENVKRINEGLAFISGPNAGKKVTQNNIVQDYLESGLKIVQHTPGLTYKWKSGIISVARNINLKTPLGGSGVRAEKLRKEVGKTIIQDPFSSLDAADVVSILVTGFPHNYESFLSHSRGIGTYNFGSGVNSSEGYFNSTFDILRNQNRALGNFEPFKNINIPPGQMAKRLELQAQLYDESKELNRLRGQLAQKQDLLNSLNSPSDQLPALQISEIDSARKNTKAGISLEISDLKDKITAINASFKEKISKGSSVGLRIYGSDLSLEIESEEGPDEEKKSIDKIRLKNELLQLRTQLRCKYNQDTNLFIVSDDYDKDLDIQAFVLNMADSLPMWDSEYKNPYEICINAAKVLDMEFFADTQGHIQFRTPKYNKIPLSLLLKMLMLQDKESIKLYPTCLESLFKSRQKSLEDESQIVNLQIEIETILLGKAPDKTINTKGDLIIVGENSPVDVGQYIQTTAGAMDFSAESLAVLLIDKRNALRTLTGGNSIEGNERDLTDTTEEIASYNDSTKPNMNTNRIAAANRLAQAISKKQKITDLLNKMNKQGGKYGDVTKLTGTPLTEKSITTQFSDLIEDDFNDLLGPGSAGRYVITDDKIIHSEFTESDQNVFCRVDVTGQENLLKMGPGMAAGDIPFLWAGATDFDLWRQYGWKQYGPVNKPFFTDGPSQCAPYAQMLLTQARKNAVIGQITVAGNEYYQLGDVVYINSRDMLYYVTTVKHSFSYSSGSFTTTLNLRMGHPLGEYIPTPMDVIGKTLIKNQKTFNNHASYRQTATRSIGAVVGTIKFDTANPMMDSDWEMKSMLLGNYYKYYTYNITQLKNAHMTLRKIVGPAIAGEYPKIEIRGFYDGSVKTSSEVLTRMEAVKKWLKNPVGWENGDLFTLSPVDFPPFRDGNFVTVDDKLDPIDMSKTQEGNEKRRPSDMAYNISDGTLEDIVEIVVVFKERPKVEEV